MVFLSNNAVITELDSIEAVRTRYSMFIANRGMTHLLIEIIDNAKDEALVGRCKNIDIFSEEKDGQKEWVVRDDGLGIPLKTNKGDDGVISIATKLFSGGKYDNAIYTSSSGANGLGVCVVNSLSKKLTITTLSESGKSYYAYYFKDGKFILRENVRIKRGKNDIPFSTEIRFVPDELYFGENAESIDEDDVVRRLSISKYMLPRDVRVTFNGQEIENKYLDIFTESRNVSLVHSECESKNGETCVLDVASYDDFDSGKIFMGIVNTLECNEGTHKNVSLNLLKNKLFAIAEKHKRHLQAADILVPMRVSCCLRLSHIDFEEQVKNTLSNDRNYLAKLIEPAVDKAIKENPEFFAFVIDKAEEYRLHLDSSKMSRKGRVGKTVVVKGLKECISRDRNERELFLVEGDSAASGLLQTRSKTEAIFPMVGKILNVLGKSKSEILNSKIINSIASVLGYKLYQPVDPEKCRYRRIYIVADADYDGQHIKCLFSFMFFTLFPELIKAGMVYIIECPLFGCTVNKNFVPIYDQETRAFYMKKKVTISHFKGLGEMNPEHLKKCVFDRSTRRCSQLMWKDFDLLALWKTRIGKLNYEE